LPCLTHGDVVDYSSPYAISNVINRLGSGKFGSVTKNIEDLITQKMQILGPYFAKCPRLVSQLLRVVTDHDEETPNMENKNVTGLQHRNVIDLDSDREDTEKDVLAPKRGYNVTAVPFIIDSDEEDDKDYGHDTVPTDHDEETPYIESEKATGMSSQNVTIDSSEEGDRDQKEDVLAPRREKDVPPAPSHEVIIIDSDEEDDKDHDEEIPNLENEKVNGMSYQNVIIDSNGEDDRDQTSFLPFHEVVLPKPVQSPALEMIVSSALLLQSFKHTFHLGCILLGLI